MMEVREPQSARFRVGLMGASLHTGNRGVSALGASLARLIWRSKPEAEIAQLIGNRTAEGCELTVDGRRRRVETVNYRLSPTAVLHQQLWWILLNSAVYRVLPFGRVRRFITRRSPWVRAVADADLVGDIRGGDSFSDTYGVRGFVLGSLPTLSVILIRGGIHLLPQTYGPFRSRLSRWLARYIVMRASSIWCRDRVGRDEVAALTRGKRRALLCPDVAFALEAVRPEQPAIEPPLPGAVEGPVVGVNVNGLVYHGGYTRANMFSLTLDYPALMRSVVSELLADPSVRVLMVPHTFAAVDRVESDPAACWDVINALPPHLRERVHIVTHEYDQNHIKGIIGMCDFFVGSRMHACIAALSQGIPTVGVAYSRKFQGVFETVGAGDWVVDARTATLDSALKRVRERFDQRLAGRALLERTVPLARRDLESIFPRVTGAAAANAEG